MHEVYSLYILYIMKTKIQKWGNSLGVRIPKYIADQKNLRDGQGVTVGLSNGQIVIEPVQTPQTLNTLLDGITAGNLHDATDWSGVVGKELW